jgi:hypothetical protein
VPTWNDAIEIARTLPQVEVGTWYGTPGLKVAGKGFARLRTEAEGGLVLMCSLEEKAGLLESGQPEYYTTPHYDGFGAIIVDLKKVSREALRELIVQSWKIKATPTLRTQLLMAGGTALPPAVSPRRSPRTPRAGSTTARQPSRTPRRRPAESRRRSSRRR